MEGGDLIGKGTYGCVFDPPLHVISRVDGKCKKLNLVGRSVGKISESNDVANEIEASKALSKIPNSSEYYVLVDLAHINKPCDVALQDDKTGIERCPTIQKKPMSHMLHFTMPYSGTAVSDYKTFTIHVKDKTPIQYEKTVIHLLEAAALLVLNNYVHYDLHQNNVLFDSLTKLPRIIDFGFSFPVSSISKETLGTRWKEYSPYFPFEAPELTAIQGTRHKITLDTIIQNITTEKEPIKRAQFVLGMSMVKQASSFQTFWKRSKSIQEGDWTTFFKFYWPGFDAWSVGVIILNLYSYVSRVPMYTEATEWKNIRGRTVEVLRGLLKMNPLERIDCVEALYIFNPESAVLTSGTATAWMQERIKMRKGL
jgi:hypothetical protein